MTAILTISAELATPDLIQNNSYDALRFDHCVNKKELSRELNYTVNVVR